jgi:hypothetical protein
MQTPTKLEDFFALRDTAVAILFKALEGILGILGPAAAAARLTADLLDLVYKIWTWASEKLGKILFKWAGLK